MTVRVVVRGVDELQDAFDAIRRDLLDEANAGFLPLARYRGQEGVPFVEQTIEQVARRRGFVTGGGL